VNGYVLAFDDLEAYTFLIGLYETSRTRRTRRKKH
jgi:hypothetical protein